MMSIMYTMFIYLYIPVYPSLYIHSNLITDNYKLK